MEQKAEKFREQSNRGRSRYGWRHTSALRQLAVSYLEECLLRGGTLGSVARKLGVSEFTLTRYQKERKGKGGFRRVEVLDKEFAQAVVLVTPEGYREEGVSESALIGLLG